MCLKPADMVFSQKGIIMTRAFPSITMSTCTYSMHYITDLICPLISSNCGNVAETVRTSSSTSSPVEGCTVGAIGLAGKYQFEKSITLNLCFLPTLSVVSNQYTPALYKQLADLNSL